jgi:hypothetical protein
MSTTMTHTNNQLLQTIIISAASFLNLESIAA